MSTAPTRFAPSGPLTGTVSVPGDKSISHRSLMLSALAVGESRITGLLEGEDVLATAAAMRAMGADILRGDDGVWTVHGVGVGGLMQPGQALDMGNSGTSTRLLMGLVASHAITCTFTGDVSLSHRPMGRVIEPLSAMGADISASPGGRLPLMVRGLAPALPLEYRLPVASAQVKSAVLLAALNAPGQTVVIEKEATRDHTERMLAGFGAEITTEVTEEGRVITLTGQPELTGQTIVVPRDPSSAAFPVCAALIVPGSDVLVPNIGLNPTRAGLFETLRDMGADLTYENPREEGGEPVADLRARYSPNMTGISVPPERAASMIDEYPVLSVVAACATGVTEMTGVKELRVKESDRIDAMARGLRACGVQVKEGPDWWSVEGMGAGNVPGGATCETFLDHRIAMSFLCLGMASKAPVTVDDGTAIATSFPIFGPLMTQLGAKIDTAG